MSHGTWLLFFLLSVASVLTPGPAMLAILGHALARGARQTLPVVLGNVAGVVALIGASVAGLATLLAAVPHAFDVVKWAGAAYLVLLGVRSMRGVDRPAQSAEPARGRGFTRGVLIAFSNPKALLFFGAVLPQFVDPARPALPQFAILAVTFATLELAVQTGVALAAQALSPLLRRAAVARGVHRAGGVALIGAAALVAFAKVQR